MISVPVVSSFVFDWQTPLHPQQPVSDVTPSSETFPMHLDPYYSLSSATPAVGLVLFTASCCHFFVHVFLSLYSQSSLKMEVHPSISVFSLLNPVPGTGLMSAMCVCTCVCVLMCMCARVRVCVYLMDVGKCTMKYALFES